MTDALPLRAFARPDGAEAGFTFGDARVTLPVGGEWRLGELDLPPHDGGLTVHVVDGIDVVAGSVPRLHTGESVRVAVATFADGRTLALIARRPQRARGHDRDEIDALVLEAGEPRAVDDPRLSVTSDGDGVPLRVGLELWLTPPPGEEDDAPPPPDYPRRAAGEVGEPALGLGAGGVRVIAHPVRWRSRGEPGFGWFAVAEAE